MKYDFTSIMDRHGKDAIAVDGLGTGFAPAAPKEGFDAIPMWVADMNFPTVPPSRKPSSSAPITPRLATSTPPMNTSIPSSGGRQSATACRA